MPRDHHRHMHRVPSHICSALLLLTFRCLHAARIHLPGMQSSMTGPKAKDVTFFVASDTHFGHVDVAGFDSLAKNKWAVDAMHATVGSSFPSNVGGGKVQAPIAVVVTGDLVQRGEDLDCCKAQWQQFESVYGFNGSNAYLRYPVYEGFGNHDGGSIADPDGECHAVRRAVRDRNARRRSPTAVSNNGLHYSWDWGPLHLVHLNLYPGNQYEAADDRGSWKQPELSRQFLMSDLASNVGNSHRPVIIFHHYGFDTIASAAFWTGQLYLAILDDYNVVAIVHGHTHVAQFYKFQGYDIFNAPATQRENATHALPPSFLVFSVDVEEGLMRVVQREGDTWSSDNYALKKIELGRLADS